MDKFIDDLEKIIVKNCYIEDNDKLRRYKNPNILVISFGLLKILDCALEYSNNSFIMQKDFFGPFEIEYLSTVPENVDDNIYINKIFNLEKLMNFDMDIVGFFHRRPNSARESIFPDNMSFKNKSRLDILSGMIKYNEDFYSHTLNEFPKNKLRDSKKMQEIYNNDLPAAFLREKDVADFLKNYISTLNGIFQGFFNIIRFNYSIHALDVNFVLSDLIKDLINIDIPEEDFLSPQNFSDTINNFVKSCHERYSPKVRDKEYDLRELLVDLLFTDVNLDDYSEINIYDPFYFSRETLDKSKEYVYSKNKNCAVNLYKRIDSNRLFKSANIDPTSVLCMILESMLLEEDTILSISDTNDSNTFNELDFDFIISDYRSKNISDEIGSIHKFQDKLDKPSKLVMIINKLQFYNKSMNWMIKNDNLEALLVFDNCFILIANSNKTIKRKNKFILIDYNILDDSYPEDTEYVRDRKLIVFKNKYSKDIISKMLKVYRDFEDSEFSKVIDNETVVKDFVYDELDKFWGDYYKNSLEMLVRYYYDDLWYISKIHTKKLDNVPIEILEKSKEHFEENYPIIHNEIEIGESNNSNKKNLRKVNNKFKFDESRKLVNINFYLKDFNYNNLMYDKKRKPYTISKQEKLDGNKSKIVETSLNSIPLYKLITFNPLEVDKEKIDGKRIELFNEIFYLKSDKFLRKFIILFLQSGKGMEEYHFFTHANICGSQKDFIYIRIPEIPLEIQEKIIKVYELNEEHYKLVKQSRDNFRKDILDYEKLEKDMENFNKMEIDINTGRIIEMSTVKRHMFDGLLWPLSISYLNAVHGTHVSNPNEKLDFYLKLFEFLTAFIDIVLISAIPEEDYNFLKEELWEGVSDNYSYKATFGTWTTLYHKLLDLYDEKDIEPKFNNDLIESLLNEDIYNIMDEVREVRNEFPGHRVSIPESRAKQLINDLKLQIDIVYDVFSYLTGFKLFYSVKVLELFDDGSNLYEVVSLNGPCDQPIYGEVTFNKRLKNNSLYLNNSMDGDLLELNKHLIKFEEVIEEYKDKKGRQKQRATGRFYLYLFNGFKKKKNKVQVRYKCYQVETDEIRKNIPLDEWEKLM